MAPEAGNGLSPEATVRVRGDHIPDVNKEQTQDPTLSTKERSTSHLQRHKCRRGGTAHMDRAPTSTRGTPISSMAILTARAVWSCMYIMMDQADAGHTCNASSMITHDYHDGTRRGWPYSQHEQYGHAPMTRSTTKALTATSCCIINATQRVGRTTATGPTRGTSAHGRLPTRRDA